MKIGEKSVGRKLRPNLSTYGTYNGQYLRIKCTYTSKCYLCL